MHVPSEEKEYMGMLEYKREDEAKIVQNLILGSETCHCYNPRQCQSLVFLHCFFFFVYVCLFWSHNQQYSDVIIGSAFRNHSCSAVGTIWDAVYQTQVSHLHLLMPYPLYYCSSSLLLIKPRFPGPQCCCQIIFVGTLWILNRFLP